MFGVDMSLDFIGTFPFGRAKRALALSTMYIPHVAVVFLLPSKDFFATHADHWLTLVVDSTIFRVVNLGALDSWMTSSSIMFGLGVQEIHLLMLIPSK